MMVSFDTKRRAMYEPFVFDLTQRENASDLFVAEPESSIHTPSHTGSFL